MIGLLKTLFFGRRTPPCRELVWMSTAAKLRGIRQAASQRAAEGRGVLLVSHFPDVLRAAEAVADECGGRAVLARDVAGRGEISPDVSAVVVCERHPHPAMDDRLTAAVADRFPEASVEIHTSLNDPVLKAVVTEEVRRMLAGLGVADDEAIELDMVSRQIRRAQERLFGHTNPDAHPDAAGGAEWAAAAYP